ncbi:MAG: TCR/Tet family MFS transporter [Pseudomonadota bacterium]
MNAARTFILVTVVIDAMGIGLILPVMPALLREIGGISLTDAAIWGSVLATAFAVMQFLFGPLIGALSDRYGRRPVLLIALFVMALDYLVMALAQVFWLLLLGRIVGGITASTQPVAAAAITDNAPASEKAARFGLIGASFGLGFVLGPVLGGFLADLGTRAPFYAAAVLVSVNCILGYFVMPETSADENRRPLSLKRCNPLGAFQNVGLNRTMRQLLLVYFLVQVGFYVYPATWSYYTIAQFGWSERTIGISLAVFGISMAFVQARLIRVFLDRLGESGTVKYGIVFNVLAFFVLAFVTNGAFAMAFLPFTALGVIVTPALQGIMSRATAEDSQGELQGVLSSTNALASIVALSIMPQVFAMFARADAPIYLPGAAFLFAMVLMLVCFVVFRRSSSGIRV